MYVMCTCTYVYICEYVYACMYVCTCVYVCVVCIYMHIYVNLYV